MTTKAQHRLTLIEYLGNPDNPYPSRADMSIKIMGRKTRDAIYKYFTPMELCEIEKEALEIRRGKYAPRIAVIDAALMDKAAGGDTAAAKLVYQRMEGWSEKIQTESKADITIEIVSYAKSKN